MVRSCPGRRRAACAIGVALLVTQAWYPGTLSRGGMTQPPGASFRTHLIYRLGSVVKSSLRPYRSWLWLQVFQAVCDQQSNSNLIYHTRYEMYSSITGSMASGMAELVHHTSRHQVAPITGQGIKARKIVETREMDSVRIHGF